MRAGLTPTPTACDPGPPLPLSELLLHWDNGAGHLPGVVGTTNRPREALPSPTRATCPAGSALAGSQRQVRPAGTHRPRPREQATCVAGNGGTLRGPVCGRGLSVSGSGRDSHGTFQSA